MSVSVLITSGKGGVGKSVLTAGIGAALTLLGSSAVIIDADIGLRSQDTLLGLENSVLYDLIDVISGDCTLEQALLDCPAAPGLKLLPASQFARVRSLDSKRFSRLLDDLKQSFDFVLTDSPAGIEKGLRTLLKAGTDKAVLIVTPDSICIRDAERTAQVMSGKNLQRPLLVVNRLDPDLIRSREMISARMIADSLDLPLLGEIPEDPAVYRSVLRHGLLTDYDCPARGAVLRIAARLRGESVPFPEIGTGRIPLLRRLFPRRLKEVVPLDQY